MAANQRNGAQFLRAIVSQTGEAAEDKVNFKNPMSVIVDHKGNYVVTSEHKVLVFSETWQLLMTIEQGEMLLRPQQIAVNSHNDYIVVGYTTQKIHIFDGSDGTHKLSFGGYGRSNGEFQNPCGVVCDKEDNIFVADSENNRVQVFDKDGGYLYGFGCYGSDRGQFNLPTQIRMDKYENLYIADYFNNRIQVMDKSGRFIRMIGSDDQLTNPGTVCVDEWDNTYVTDDKHLISVFNRAGELLYQIGTAGEFSDPWGMCIDKTNKLITCEFSQDRIQVWQLPPPNVWINHPSERAIVYSDVDILCE